MIDAGEPEEKIGAEIKRMKAANEPPVAPSASLVSPGALTAVGVPMALFGEDAVKPAFKYAGKALEKAAFFPKLLGGGLGAAVGGTAASSVGLSPFMGVHMGGSIGAYGGRQLATPVREVGKRLGELSNNLILPASRRTVMGVGRRGVNMLAESMPYIGGAMTAADIGMDLYNNREHLSENVAKSLDGGSLNNPEDQGHGLESLIRELLHRSR
jgi:hypothetical protein